MLASLLLAAAAAQPAPAAAQAAPAAVPPVQAAPAVVPAAPAAPAAVPADWRNRPIDFGHWTWRGTSESSEAIFSDARGPQLVIRCTRATRRVSFSRSGAAPTAPLRIATTSSERQLTAANMVLASDPLLDAIAFTRGRLWVGAAGTPPLILRSAPEAARAVEDCRS